MIEYVRDMWLLATAGEKQGILFFVVIYAFIVCFYSFIRQALIRQWPVTKGTLQTASVETWGAPAIILSDQDYKVNSLYEYQVGNMRYQGTRVSPWIIVVSHNARFILTKQLQGIQKNIDGTVNVVYNPKNPAKSYLMKPGLFGMSFTLAIAILPLVLYLNAYV